MAILPKEESEETPPIVYGSGMIDAPHAAILRGEIRIELCGHLEHAEGIKGFTLDKRRYEMTFQDETEDFITIIIKERSR